ncbi:uncharacterized protein LOC128994811 [Macrosteles quadrilineatus]|uniref:uncharacterized protein LOC128994811 n=1 Tax=Macrosteles quadrilineatus TaxID=74068 RepID=UPI0023E27CED|nr:uncharacterized protein LOC128994811 [Macrosteles quadrilineatus]
MLKQTMTTVSDRVFPVLGYSINHSKGYYPNKSLGNEITSNFPLQIALFFNLAFLPVWLTTIGVMLPLKYCRLPDLYKIILVITLVAAITIEITRLYMGYLGNLTENIPGMPGFWMLSLLLQAPLQLLLLHPMLLFSVVENVTQTVMCYLCSRSQGWQGSGCCLYFCKLLCSCCCFTPCCCSLFCVPDPRVGRVLDVVSTSASSSAVVAASPHAAVLCCRECHPDCDVLLVFQIPGLAGFWMLSLLLQAPLQLLLLHPMLLSSVVEIVTQTVMCCLLCVQLVSGFIALHRVAKHSSAKFHIAQFFNENDNRVIQ